MFPILVGRSRTLYRSTGVHSSVKVYSLRVICEQGLNINFSKSNFEGLDAILEFGEIVYEL